MASGVCTRLRPQPLTELDEWLEPYRSFWGDRLDALEQHLDNSREEHHA